MKSEIIEIQWSWDQPIVQKLLLKYYRDWLFVTQDIADNMVERILSISHVQPPGHVLDIGCGLGYHASAFAKKGFEVFAFDPGDQYLKIAKSHVETEGTNVILKRMICADFNENRRFELAWAGSYCPGQLSPSEVVQDFSRIYRALKPGGWFISNVAGKPKIPPMEKVRNWRQLPDSFCLTEKWADDTYFHEHCWFVSPQGNKVIKLVEVEQMYGVEEIVPLLEAAGFTDISTADRLNGDASAQAGKHFAFWCRKSGT